MFPKSNTEIYTILYNIYHHIKRNYDYVLVISGDTGSGKSMLGLHILESWYKVILGQEITEEHIKNVNVKYHKFAARYRDLKRYDLNIFDEGSTALDSKDALTKLSKNLSKMFDVMRVKGIFSVIILPSFFNLNKYFRENRLRGAIHIAKRGQYRYFTKKQIMYLNVKNSRFQIKNMHVVNPLHRGTFSDYKGILREPYDKLKAVGVDEIIEEVTADYIGNYEYKPAHQVLYSKVKKIYDEHKAKGKFISQGAIANKLHTSQPTISQIVQRIRAEEEDEE